MVRPASSQLTESFELWMKYNFATVQLDGFTAPGLPLARWTGFFNYKFWDEARANNRAWIKRPNSQGTSVGEFRVRLRGTKPSSFGGERGLKLSLSIGYLLSN